MNHLSSPQILLPTSEFSCYKYRRPFFFLLGGYLNHFAVFRLCNLNFNFKFKAPLLARKAKLQDAERLKRFLHDVEDEEAWIREKEPIASSTNTGRDLTGAQNLSKKHQALMVCTGKKS